MKAVLPAVGAMAVLAGVLAIPAVQSAYAISPGPAQDLRIVNGELFLANQVLVQVEKNPGPAQDELGPLQTRAVHGAMLIVSDASARLTDWAGRNPGPINDPAVQDQLNTLIALAGRLQDNASDVMALIDPAKNPGPIQDLQTIEDTSAAMQAQALGLLSCDPAAPC